jgi:DNA replication protein DnaC
MTSAWEKRFPNPHTRPDPTDEYTARRRREARDLFGFDPLETAVSTEDHIRELQAKWATPEYQAYVAQQAREAEHQAELQADLQYRRSIERLSPVHVKAVLGGCDADLNPITTTDLQRKVIAQWDGVTSLFLLGRTGVGKTYAGTWAAMRLARGGKDVASTTALRVAQESLEGLLTLRKVGVLVLDQLHTLRSPAGRDAPAWQVTPVVDLIDYRYEHQLVTIGAGTIAPDRMVDLLGADVKRRFPLRLASDATGVSRKEGA